MHAVVIREVTHILVNMEMWGSELRDTRAAGFDGKTMIQNLFGIYDVLCDTVWGRKGMV